MRKRSFIAGALLASALAGTIGCVPAVREAPSIASRPANRTFYGTLEPFAADPVYFLMTDRFVNGDPGNDQRTQGGVNHTFDRPLVTKSGVPDNIGYLGGDFRGILDNAVYIREMGFGAIWLTPIVDNPDEAFTGGQAVGEGHFADKGKTGYHGYWGVNFYELDEHLPSPGLDFAELTRRLRDDYGLKTVLDIVANHGSPAWSMPVQQPEFGQIFGPDGQLVADHQNLPPAQLDASNPLHRFYRPQQEMAQLSNLDDRNPEVVDYLVNAYLKWIDQGADALRIDTIMWVPHPFWAEFTRRIRAEHPGLFMFAEAFDYNPRKIAEHTLPENGGVSVLDFPGREAIVEVFSKPGSDFAALSRYLLLEDRIYHNPYELMTFYDNHDMPRMNASDAGFIDAHNWLFTSRGIPVIYYGSEMAFMRGAAEHQGNRNYLGVDNIALAREHPIRKALVHVANLRRQSIALQRGLQVNLALHGDHAAFLRVYENDDVHQTALVLLNKGETQHEFALERDISPGTWIDAVTGETTVRRSADPPLRIGVAPHAVRVLLLNERNAAPGLEARLARAMTAIPAQRGH